MAVPLLSADALPAALERLYAESGRDFRDYAPSWAGPRLEKAAASLGLEGVRELAESFARPEPRDAALAALARVETPFFADPAFARLVRGPVVERLRTYPSPLIWQLACGAGQPAYELAAILAEEGLLARGRIYATDLAEAGLETARAGRYPLAELAAAAPRHRESGAAVPLSRHYDRLDDGGARFKPALRERVCVLEHSLPTDSSPNEFHFAVCREPLSRFNRALQNRVLGLLHESLCPFGLLAAPADEPLRHRLAALGFEPAAAAGLYRKVPAV